MTSVVTPTTAAAEAARQATVQRVLQILRTARDKQPVVFEDGVENPTWRALLEAANRIEWEFKVREVGQ